MCFSATASFAAATVLIPAGLYSVRKSCQLDKSYWAFAMLPLLFGLQQLIEGRLWLALQDGRAGEVHYLALGFILFSHVIWLGWVPFSAYLTEVSPKLKRTFLLVAVIGVLFGMSMYVPLLLNENWLAVSIVKHSIHYQPKFIFDVWVSQNLITVIYACILLTPLILSTDPYHRMLGALVFLSGLVTGAFFEWAFVSVWCYFAAIVSLYIFFMIYRSVSVSQVPGSVS